MPFVIALGFIDDLRWALAEARARAQTESSCSA